jgi:hypothetical protein
MFYKGINRIMIFSDDFIFRKYNKIFQRAKHHRGSIKARLHLQFLLRFFLMDVNEYIWVVYVPSICTADAHSSEQNSPTPSHPSEEENYT